MATRAQHSIYKDRLLVQSSIRSSIKLLYHETFFPILPLLFQSLSLFAQDFALEQLENSPRHHEWVEVKSDDRMVHCFVAYPETSENTLAVIVIHENRGLTDWVRSFADQMAAAGYLAIAPDFIPATEKMMQEAGKTYEHKIYPGAGHAYMRQGDDPEGSAASKKATADSWERIKDILEKI